MAANEHSSNRLQLHCTPGCGPNDHGTGFTLISWARFEDSCGWWSSMHTPSGRKCFHSAARQRLPRWTASERCLHDTDVQKKWCPPTGHSSPPKSSSHSYVRTAFVIDDQRHTILQPTAWQNDLSSRSNVPSPQLHRPCPSRKQPTSFWWSIEAQFIPPPANPPINCSWDASFVLDYLCCIPVSHNVSMTSRLSSSAPMGVAHYGSFHLRLVFWCVTTVMPRTTPGFQQLSQSVPDRRRTLCKPAKAVPGGATWTKSTRVTHLSLTLPEAEENER